MAPKLSLNDPAFVGGMMKSVVKLVNESVQATETKLKYITTPYVPPTVWVQIRFRRYSTTFSRKYLAPSTSTVCYVYGSSCYDESISGTVTSGSVGNFTSLSGVSVPLITPSMSIHDLFADASYWGANSGNYGANWKITIP